MYPFTVYVSEEPGILKPLRKVIINSYVENISFSAFRRAMLTAPHELRARYGGYKPYEHTFDAEYFEEMWPKREILDKQETPLFDFYKEIGWDYKKKKLDGKTLKRYIVDGIKED